MNVECGYCGINDSSILVQCLTCCRWFCNGRTGTSGSHVIHHLVLAKHKEVGLHSDSLLGETILECYQCKCRNVFLLGFIPAKSDTVVVLLCRQQCISTGSNKDINWDTSQWFPLIEDKMFLPWLVPTPTKEQIGDKMTTASQINRVEENWKRDVGSKLEQHHEEEEELKVAPIIYENIKEYQNMMNRLVDLESEYDKKLKESQIRENVDIRWDSGSGSRKIAWISCNRLLFDNDIRICIGDELKVRYDGDVLKWYDEGHVIKVGSSANDEIGIELKEGNAPIDIVTGFVVEFVWKATSFERMKWAVKRFCTNKNSASRYIRGKIMKIDVKQVAIECNPPESMSISSLPELNHSQIDAIKTALRRPLSLIQGPPGTGKTVTCAALVYHLVKLSKNRILVCAPSNVAIDQLTLKIHSSGLRVVRVTAKSRESLDSSINFLTLHEQMLNHPLHSELRGLILKRIGKGKLESKEESRYKNLRQKCESEILNSAEVVCTTCVGAGDPRLTQLRFGAVLIDEATQASEPECLIPIVKGPKQVILVGDHKQLGPVIMNKRAAKIGLSRSLFERLILVGVRPLRLQVQYRMHPCLSVFPSNTFYEGSLQNGVGMFERTRSNLVFPWPDASSPMAFLNCSGGSEEISSSGTSYLNRFEAVLCEKIVTRLLDTGIDSYQIGIITPYEGQKLYIMNIMSTNGSLSKEGCSMIEVDSVDAFQGREKDYIILSCVRSSETQGIGFLGDARRLNVALTRARYGLVILGDAQVLSRNSLWYSLLTHFQERGCLLDGSSSNLDPINLFFRSHKSKRQNRPLSHHRSNIISTPQADHVSADTHDTIHKDLLKKMKESLADFDWQDTIPSLKQSDQLDNPNYDSIEFSIAGLSL
jgi:regulator of nonsense transcripts 1